MARRSDSSAPCTPLAQAESGGHGSKTNKAKRALSAFGADTTHINVHVGPVACRLPAPPGFFSKPAKRTHKQRMLKFKRGAGWDTSAAQASWAQATVSGSVQWERPDPWHSPAQSA